MRAPRTSSPATLLPRTSRPGTAETPRPIWHWRGSGPALTPRGLVPLHIEGAAPVVMTPSGPGLRIERGTTNFVTNPSFELDLAGWNAIAGASISRETADGGAFGSAYARVAVNANGDGIRFAGTGNAAQGQPYTASMYFRAATPSDVGKIVQIYLDAPGGTYEIFATEHVLTNAWTRVVLTATWAQAGHTGWGVVARCAIAQGVFVFHLDAAQYEQGADSTYADGSLGTGYTWMAIQHESPSVRAGAILRSYISQHVTAVSASVIPFWNAMDGEGHTVLDIRGTAGQHLRLSAEPSGVWRMTLGAGGQINLIEVAQAHEAIAPVTLIAKWTAGYLEFRAGASATRSPLTVMPKPRELSLGRQEGTDGEYLTGVLTSASIFGP